jgi:hypothetical protein
VGITWGVEEILKGTQSPCGHPLIAQECVEPGYDRYRIGCPRCESMKEFDR